MASRRASGVHQLHRQPALGIQLRVGAADTDSGFLQDLVPRLRP